MTRSSRGKYRPDIDGLRALAIALVVLFHFKVRGITGGFVGVDVFFVISGYLITRNILSDLNDDRFTFSRFYVRRIRRIVPSFLAVAFLALAAGFFVLPPGLYASASESGIWATCFASNIHFWTQVGYFDAEKYTKVFLHTWSLGIEEQFYLIWPFVLWISFRYLRVAHAIILIAIATFLSFILSVHWVQSTTVDLPFIGSRYTDTSDAFYLLPFRLWQLSIGGLLAFPSAARFFDRLAPSIGKAAVFAGLLLIAGCAVLYTPQTLFPGLAALWPTLGAAALVAFGERSFMTPLSRLPAIRYVGQISYALYLTHWPVIVLYKSATGSDPTIVGTVALILLSVAIAAIVMRFIERPFRAGKLSSPKGMTRMGWALLACATGLLVATSLSIINRGGLPQRYMAICGEGCREHHQLPTVTLDGEDKLARSFGGGVRSIGSHNADARSILVVGDSHAGHFAPALDAIGLRHNLGGVTWGFPGCPPVFGTHKIYWETGLDTPSATQNGCRKQIELWRKHTQERHYDLVVLAARWTHLFEDVNYGELRVEYAQIVRNGEPIGTREEGREIFKSSLRKMILELTEGGSSVLLLSQVPPAGRNLENCNELSRFLVSGDELDEATERRCRPVALDKALDRLNFTNSVLRDMEDKPSVRTFLPTDVMCNPESRHCSTVAEGKLLYADDDHISVEGARFLEPSLEQIIVEMLEAR